MGHPTFVGLADLCRVHLGLQPAFAGIQAHQPALLCHLIQKSQGNIGQGLFAQSAMGLRILQVVVDGIFQLLPFQPLLHGSGLA